MTMNHEQTGSAKLIKLTVILAVCGILVIGAMLMPKGFKDDLSLIGQGSVSVVLVHNKELVDSTIMMELLNSVRSDYAGKVDFLAVDIATPIGQMFIQKQRVGVIDLVIFAPNGSRQGVLNNGVSEQQLRSVLDEALSP
ncbi:MAG: hypothetical protein ACI9D5_002666 [Candidatus Endobugula sp.]|jgi:hypothetical protein